MKKTSKTKKKYQGGGEKIPSGDVKRYAKEFYDMQNRPGFSGLTDEDHSKYFVDNPGFRELLPDIANTYGNLFPNASYSFQHTRGEDGINKTGFIPKAMPDSTSRDSRKGLRKPGVVNPDRGTWVPGNRDPQYAKPRDRSGLKRPTPRSYRYGGYAEHPRLTPPQLPNMPDSNREGNILGGTMSGAAAGSAVLPGIGTAVGGALGAIGGLFKNRSTRKNEEAVMDQYQDQVGNFQSQLLGQNYMTQHNIPTFQRGGQKQGGFEDELLSGATNAEVEGEEIIQSPMGEMAAMTGPSHEQGGIDVNMDPGDRVYSDELKDDDGKTFAEKADKLRKSNEKYQKVLDDPRATKLAKFTANKMIQKLSGNLDNLFQKQESLKPQQPQEQLAEGPIDAQPQFALGGQAWQKLGRDALNVANQANEDQGYSWGNLMGDAATYGPAAYNLFKGAFGSEPDIEFDPNQYSGYQEVTPRRVSLDPIRRDIEGRERASNRAIRQMGTDTTGATYSRMAANAADTKRAMANAAMTEEQAYSQADLQAQMANQQAAMQSQQIGMKGAATYEDMIQKARGVPTAHLTAGLTQLSDIAQSRRLMRNQRTRDTQRGHALEGFSNMFGYDQTGMGFDVNTDPERLNQRYRGAGRLGRPIRRNNTR